MAHWPWRRILVWTALILLAHLLRDLLPLLFLTFIFAYIADGIVTRLLRSGPYRRFYTALVFLSFFALFAIFVSFAVPQVYDEARRGVRLMATKIQEQGDEEGGETMTQVERGGRRLLGPEVYDQLADSPFARRLLGEAERMVTVLFERIAAGVGGFVAGGIRLIFFALIAGLLAFIIVWDLPRIQAGLALLENGRFGDQYREIFPMIVSFLSYIGQAFQGLIAVAAINGLQMIPMLWFFGVPKIALLSTIVFFFSLVPIFGVIIAFIPVALVTFQAGGLSLVIIIAILYFGINTLETYTINAWIMGLFFRSHVLLVLVLLLSGEHLFGIWGLLLAVPIGHYAVEYGLLGRKASFS
jgi:predicted PurR-regulated permease PerM